MSIRHSTKRLLTTGRLIAIAAALLTASLTVSAQPAHPEQEAVLQVVEQFFESINTGDSELLASLEVDGAQILNIREAADGEPEFVQRDWYGADAFSDDTRLTERYWDEELLISDHFAVFWTPYDFHIDGDFSHCGIDVINLIRIDGEWKISHAMWSIQRSGCAPSPLGPLN